MLFEKVKFVALLFTLVTFLSMKTSKNRVHEEYYTTGELKYICADHYKKPGGEGTAMFQRITFKRTYFDKCENPRLTIQGTHEIGCWQNTVILSKYHKQNENDTCSKEPFVYLTTEELIAEIKKEN